MMMMRSCDVAAGLPFNIASTALLTSLLAHILGVETDRVIVVTGDTHLYGEHLDGANEQIERKPYAFPKLTINRPPPSADASIDEKVRWLETLKFEDIVVSDYTCHPPIKYEMIA